jgi:hypothetical protein
VATLSVDYYDTVNDDFDDLSSLSDDASSQVGEANTHGCDPLEIVSRLWTSCSVVSPPALVSRCHQHLGSEFAALVVNVRVIRVF